MFKVDLEKFSGLVALARVGTCLLSGCMHVSGRELGVSECPGQFMGSSQHVFTECY